MQQENDSIKLDLVFQSNVKILNTSSKLLLFLNKLLKVHKLTFQQYFVLRIAKYADYGISIKYINANMFDSSSNTSRLIDKLSKKGLVRKEISMSDKRIANIYLTEDGFLTINKAMITLSTEFNTRASDVTNTEMLVFNQLLDRLNDLLKD